MEELERWSPVVGFEGWYDISDFGNVRRMKDGNNTFVGRILKPVSDGRGYLNVILSKHGKYKKIGVHRLVMAAFVGPCAEGIEVNHIDGDKGNNHRDNLEYVTRSENELHAHRTGLKSNRGENHPYHKLTEKNVHEIRRRLGKETQKSIAVSFGVARETISKIATGKTWAYLKEGGRMLMSEFRVEEREELLDTLNTKDDTLRIIYRINTGEDYQGPAKLRSACIELIEKEDKAGVGYKAIAFFFWGEGMDVGEEAALASLTYAPGGRWESTFVPNMLLNGEPTEPMKLVVDFNNYAKSV